MQISTTAAVVLLTTHLSLFWTLPEDDESTNGVQHENAIMSQLQARLPKYMQPDDLRNGSVHVFLDLYQISAVNEKDGILTVKLWFYNYYYSQSAHWNVTEHGGRTLVIVPADTFWRADIVPLDAIDVKYQMFDRQTVHGNYGIVVGWSSVATVQFSCSFDVSGFPSDTQSCPLQFGPWASSDVHYHLRPDPDILQNEADLTYYKEHEEWELLRPVSIYYKQRSWRNRFNYTDIVLDVNLKRRSLFYSVIFILPNLLIYALSSVTFLLPVESGEKVSFVITLLLAAVVSFGTISSILPASSKSFPIVASFLGAVVSQMTLDTFLTAIVINIHYIGGRSKMGCRLRRIISSKVMYGFWMKPCPMERSFPGITPELKAALEETEKTLPSEVEGGSESSSGRSMKKFYKSGVWDQVGVVLAESEAESKSKEKANLKEMTMCQVVEQILYLESEQNMEFLWIFFSKVVDRFFLYCHLIMTIAILLHFFT